MKEVLSKPWLWLSSAWFLGTRAAEQRACDSPSRMHLVKTDDSPPLCGSPPAETCLVQLDSMSFSHQMLVRYAAVAAVASLTFTTGLLLEILPCWNMKMMTKALAGLMKSGVFGCFRSSKELRTALEHNEASSEVHHRSSCLKPREGVGKQSLEA